MLTLYFSYWIPGRSLAWGVEIVKVSPDKNVSFLRRQISQAIAVNTIILLHLYKIPDPVPLDELETTSISLSDLGKPLSVNLSLASVFGSQPAPDHLHLVVVNPNIPLAITCWIRGSHSDIPIDLEVPPERRVIHFLDVVREKYNLLGVVEPERLQLYKLSHAQEENIFEAVQSTGLGHLLPKKEMLETVFNDVPLNKVPCVVVEVVSLENKRVPNWDVADRASKKPKFPPSHFGPSEYLVTQQNVDTRFIDFRPIDMTKTQPELQPLRPDSQLPPCEVLYTGFGEFLDTYRAQRDSQVGRRSAALRHEVEMFAEEMTRVYSGESPRQSNGLRHLTHMFFGSPHPVIVPSNIHNATTDGHFVYGDFGIPCVFVEFKNEEAQSKAIPAIQLATYYHLSVTVVEGRRRELIYRSRLPALGITIIGPVITFYAMAWAGSVVRFPLTPGISCVSCATGGDDRRALHGAFIAARDLLSRIENDAKKLTENPSPRLLSHFFPDITELPFFGSDGSFNFEIMDVMQSGYGRILYHAESRPPGLDLVIKFTRSYSVDLHKFCADRGHAPTIRGFKKLPGNIMVVAMDYIKGDILGPEGSQDLRNGIAQQMKRLVEDFHAAGYVHGDLRCPNIYRVEDTIQLLDFDWAGKVGEAFYPHQTLTDVLREGRDMDNLMITKEDDERVLKISLESIGCS